jgi:alpha/beta superfamily hydrolase
MSGRASRVRSLTLAGPAGALETLVDTPAVLRRAVAVVCHPHPLHDGTMHNKVTHTLARAFAALGAPAVRFNFRGVGASEGIYADGEGELGDALAVIDWAAQEWPGSTLYLAGFSFGAAVALRAALERLPGGLVTIALPVARVPAGLPAPACPWLAVHGDRDEVVPLEEVRDRLAAIVPPPELVVMEGATHFFHGKLTALADEVKRFFAADLTALPSVRASDSADSAPEGIDAQRPG